MTPNPGAAQNIAVVILNYNGVDWLRKFLPNVIDCSREARVVVIDNGSTDNSISMLRMDYPSIEIIDNNENLGFCGGYNRGLSKIDAGYFVLLNNDVEVTRDWLKPMKELLDSNPNIAAVQPKILSYRNKGQFEYAGAGGGFIDSLGYPFCRGRIFDTVENDNGQYNDTIPVFWATGACLVVRSRVFTELGGFDEDFFAHMEEIDLCWRLKRKGYGVYYCGTSTVYHVGGGTLAAANPRKTYFNFRNGMAMILKHQRGSELLWKLPLRFFLDWAAAARFLLGSPSHTWAILKAHGYVLTHAGSILSKRRALKSFGFNVREIFPGSIIWRYFVKGEKKYPSFRR